MSEVIFTTIHGSHLYGLAGPFSDVDTYTVTTSSGRARQKVDGVQDSVTIGWGAFLEYAYSGSHQACEALFSREKVWHSREYLQPFLDGVRVTGPDAMAKYRRTIVKFAHSGDFKRRRHACRLALNLDRLRRDGVFNPRMNKYEIAWANALATDMRPGGELASLLLEDWDWSTE